MADIPATEHDLSPEHRAALNRVRKDKELSERARKPYIDRWDEWYGLHRNYRRYVRATAEGEAGRDEILDSARDDFGRELFIPYVFTVIETMTPRLLMNNPRLKVKARSIQLGFERAEAVRHLFEERQSEIDFALKLIPTARRGLKYGLGVQKTFWNRKEHNWTAIERGIFGQRKVTPRTEVIEGPDNEDVELYDFFWDPAGKDVPSLRYAIHRTWRDFRYIRERIERGEWLPIDLDAVRRMGSETERGSMLQARAEAAGLKGYNTDLGRLHEVLEWHDGERVITALDNALVVQDAPSPFEHRQLPFQIFRPTLQEGEFVGISEIEPIVHLQHEINTLRSQRRWNAMMVLQKAFLYAEGLVDPADLIIGPGKGIPVFGAPGEVIQPLDIGEIPLSGYREEDAIKSDFELASGISETVAGAEGSGKAAETATGVQLVQAAANVRIEMKTKMLSHETIKPTTAQWLELYRQHTLDAREVIVAAPSGDQLVQVTPEDLDLVRAVVPEDDSTAPENSPQKRNDALALHNQTRGSEVIDQRRSFLYLLKAFDVPDSESWILPEQTQLNPQVAQVVGEAIRDTLRRAGVKDDEAEELALVAVQQAMGAAGVSEPAGATEQNGGSPSE